MSRALRSAMERQVAMPQNTLRPFTSVIQLDTSNTQAVSANLSLRYNHRPDSDLYVIFNEGTQFKSIAPANPPQSGRHGLL